MNYTKTLRLLFALIVTAFVSSAVVSTTAAQETKEETKTTKPARGGRDPFVKYVPPRVITKKSALLMPPSIQERIAQYKAQKQSAMMARVAAPKPTTAFLLSELQVVGISRSPRGYAAIVEAMPIKLAYIIYPGEKFYDGQLVAIEDGRLVFRRETVFSDGRRERSVEMKPLRQPNVVADLAAVKSSSATGASEASKPAEEKPPTEKP